MHILCLYKFYVGLKKKSYIPPPTGNSKDVLPQQISTNILSNSKHQPVGMGCHHTLETWQHALISLINAVFGNSGSCFRKFRKLSRLQFKMCKQDLTEYTSLDIPELAEVRICRRF